MKTPLPGFFPYVIGALALLTLCLAIAPARALFLMSRSRKMAEDAVMVRAYRLVAIVGFAGLMVLLYKGW